MASEKKDDPMDAGRRVDRQNAQRAAPGPHERDETPDGGGAAPRGVIRQAAEDLAQGLVDTEARATPGIEQAVQPQPGASGQANPLPGRQRDMRDHDTAPAAGQEKNQ